MASTNDSPAEKGPELKIAKVHAESEFSDIQTNLWPTIMPNEKAVVTKIYDEAAITYEDNTTKDGWVDGTFGALRPAIEDAFKKGGKIVLDAGCATGLMAKVIDLPADIELHGFDLSPDCLALAKAGGRYSSLQQVDINDPLPYKSEMFDLIVCNGVLGYCETNKPIAELVRVLKPGSHLLIAFRHADFVERLYEKHIKDRGDCELVNQVLFDPFPNNPAYEYDYVFADVRKTVN